MPDRVAWKRRIGRLYALLHARDAGRRLILIYHSVGGSPDATDPGMFRRHLELIAATGRLVALPELVQGADRGIAAAITFDDGYATLRDRAAPILADFDGVATAFLNAGEIADDERRPSRAEDGYYAGEQFLSWRDVEALRAAGWHFGSHGVRHLDLVRSDAMTVERELNGSKAIIEERLGTACEMFAYPWGRNSAALRAAVGAAGYRYGLAGGHSPVTAQADAFALPRINVAKEYSADDLAAILRGDWDYLHWLAKAKSVIRCEV